MREAAWKLNVSLITLQRHVAAKRFLFQRFKKSVGFACGSGVKETSSGPERNLQA